MIMMDNDDSDDDNDDGDNEARCTVPSRSTTL